MKNRTQSANDEFIRFTSSVHFDGELWRYDIAGSIAHAHALEKARLLSQKERLLLVDALRETADDIRGGSLVLDPDLEDIHMNIENAVTKKAGDTGRKLHTGRSRNDQVALDVRLLVRDRLADIVDRCVQMQTVLLAKAVGSRGVILPGYTHMQHAQPVLLSHHMLAHFWRLQRDIERFASCYSRTNISPLGSGALAGTSFELDRSLTAELLAMDDVTANSMDAVSDRDFVAEAIFSLSLLMIHLSSLSEELVLWSSSEFGFVKLPKELSSGSSMMPQKRNPDLPELVRGKSGRVVGDLVAILTLLKSLPLAYNRDLQEDKESLFDAFDTAEACLRALTGFLQAAEFDKVRTRKAAGVGLLTATDLADFLASNGIPFRKAHQIVGDLAEKSGGDAKEFVRLAGPTLEEHGISAPLGPDFLSAQSSVERRSIVGGTSTSAVKKQLKSARMNLDHSRKVLASMNRHKLAIERLLNAQH